MADISVERILARLARVAEEWPEFAGASAAWRRSTFCNGADACLEAKIRWVRACSHNGNCVEVACRQGEMLVRDSKLGEASPVLRIPAADWDSFLDAVKTGSMGWAGGLVTCWRRDGDWVMTLNRNEATGLHFTEAEMSAFVKGIHAHEFDLTALAKDGSPATRGAGPLLADFGAGSVPA